MLRINGPKTGGGCLQTSHLYIYMYINVLHVYVNHKIVKKGGGGGGGAYKEMDAYSREYGTHKCKYTCMYKLMDDVPF